MRDREREREANKDVANEPPLSESQVRRTNKFGWLPNRKVAVANNSFTVCSSSSSSSLSNGMDKHGNMARQAAKLPLLPEDVWKMGTTVKRVSSN